ncbi:MAG: GxxExxY protein [Candidatus Aureabacteria bacterium]|nr:GxxExxY protein [Candidatus Auribacterota bacterium]
MKSTEDIEDTEYTEKEYPYSTITDKIIKCAIEVHKIFGPGFVEGIYENALIYELKKNGLRVEQQKLIDVKYKGECVGEHRLDLLVEDTVIVENKTVTEFNDIHFAQILSYLKATEKKIALSLNFADTKIQVKRVIL